MSSLARKFQQRLLNSNKYGDYVIAFLIPFIPVILSMILGIWKHTKIEDYRFTGYENAINQMTLIISLPLSIFLLRYTSNKLFGLNLNNHNFNKVPILKLFSNTPDIQSQIHTQLKESVFNDIIVYIILIIDIVFHWFDNNEYIKQYFFTFLGYKIQYNEIYWANLYLVNKIDIRINLIFTILAYSGQFIIFIIALIAIYLLFSYNLFYLNLIYQRHKHRNNIRGKIVLNFDDANCRFGLNDINSSFNLQLFVLIFAEIVLLGSRIPLTTEMILPRITDFDPIIIINNQNLFPYFGQYIIVSLWLLTFFIVMMPTLVKFLPFFSPNRSFQSRAIVEYLREFIPPSEDYKYNLNLREVVDDMANKFAWNSFWPSGDDTARFMLYFVFFVCFVILFPRNSLNYISVLVIIIIISVLLGNIFLNIFKWFLGHVDEKLVKRKDIKPGDKIMTVNFNQQNQTVTYQYNAAGNISFGSVTNRVDLIGELEKLNNEVSKAGENNVIDAEQVIDVQGHIQKAVVQAKKPEPNKNSILEYLGNAKELISGVVAANGIVTGLMEAIELVKQFF
ncbi:MAG: hypothetical protein HEQ10_21615 [Dolichospermum sp. DEX182a]|nr:hypothetical protein [Dolichospermum sp. DEX182a]